MTFPKYHKIRSIFKRDMAKEGNPLIIGECSLPEFTHLYNTPWIFSEKIDGMNIRILWDGHNITIGGRTNDAQIHPALANNIADMLHKDKLTEAFNGKTVVIFGEGYGGKIQKGHKYSPVETFACFDIFIGGFWLERGSIEAICRQLNLPVVHKVGRYTLGSMFEKIKRTGIPSFYGDFEAEGVVGTPASGLLCRNGNRIITKIKCCDLKNG